MIKVETITKQQETEPQRQAREAYETKRREYLAAEGLCEQLRDEAMRLYWEWMALVLPERK